VRENHTNAAHPDTQPKHWNPCGLISGESLPNDLGGECERLENPQARRWKKHQPTCSAFVGQLNQTSRVSLKALDCRIKE
jgi:hypothetical protein